MLTQPTNSPFLFQKAMSLSASYPCHQNCHRQFEILFFRQANKLACYSSTDTGRRHTIPEVETKDFITHGRVDRQGVMSTLVPLSPKSHRAQVDAAHTAGLCRSWGALHLGKLNLLPGLLANRPDLCTQRTHNLYLPRLFSMQMSLKR